MSFSTTRDDFKDPLILCQYQKENLRNYFKITERLMKQYIRFLTFTWNIGKELINSCHVIDFVQF